MKKMILAIMAILALSGCARLKNRIAAKGGLIGAYEGDYVVISQSGGLIMDIWVLNDVIVQDSEMSDGWLFRNSTGDVINIAGDVKVIRAKNQRLLDQYHEYHMEFESQTYREKYAKQ